MEKYPLENEIQQNHDTCQYMVLIFIFDFIIFKNHYKIKILVYIKRNIKTTER